MSAAAVTLLLLGEGVETPYAPPSDPVVESIAQSAWTDNAATSHPVTMPTGCNAGDLKIVLFDNDLGGTDVTVTTPAGWTALFSTAQSTNNRFGVYVRIHVDGDPSTVDFVTSSGRQGAAQALRVTGWRGTISGGVEANTPQSGTGSKPNPNSFSPTFGAGNNLWLAVLGDSSVTPITSAPSGYSTLTSTVSAQTTAGAQVYSAQKTSTSGTEDPGAWTFAAGGARVYSTIAIAPAAGLTLEPADGTSWFLDSAIAASGDGSSWATAWKAFSDIQWGSIQPGDTLYVSGGSTTKTCTGTMVIGAAGTAGSPITITRGLAPGHNGQPIFDGQNGASTWYGIDNGYGGTARSYVTVSRLKLQNYASAGLHARNVAAGMIFDDCDVVMGTVTTDHPRGIDVRGNTGIIVRRCRITNSGVTTGQTDGIYSQGNVSFLYEDNDIDITNTDGTGHSDCFQSYLDGSGTVRRNIFRSPTAGGDNKVAWCSDTLTGAVVEFYNNLCISRGGQYNVSHWRSGAGVGTGLFRIYNNTIVGGARGVNLERVTTDEVKNNIIVPDASAYGIYMNLNDLPTGNILNNLIHNVTNVGRTVANGNRTWAQFVTTDGFNAGGVNADPLFVGGADYSLQAGSPAISAGATLAAVTTDILGVSRPQGAGYDIGAYER